MLAERDLRAVLHDMADDAASAPERSLDDALRSLRAAGADTGSAGRRRRRIIGLASAAGVAAAAAAVVVTLVSAPAHSGSTSHEATGAGGTGTRPTVAAHGPELSGNTIELAGYRIALPANYKLGKADTNCTADLHLSADETKRLVTTPTPGCPLLVTSVARALPPDASKNSFSQGRDDGTVVSFTTWSSEQTREVYLPTKLPDGTTVYVTLDGSDVRPGQAGVYFNGGLYSVRQLEEFEQGVKVTATSELPTYTGTPVDKPTVNCNANCNN
jgi:plasmid stabilization system protein ParE